MEAKEILDSFNHYNSPEELAAAISFFHARRAQGEILPMLAESISLYQIFREMFNLGRLSPDEGAEITSRGKTLDAKFFIMCGTMAKLLWEQKNKANNENTIR